MEKEQQIYGFYEELKGILASIPSQSSWFDDDGFSVQANNVIERASSLCPEITDLDSYKIGTTYLEGRGWIIDVIPTKTKIQGLIGRIKGTYGFDNMSQSNTGHTFIQQQSQSQEQYQTMILDLQERILSVIQNHAEGSKKRSFLEKLKSSLPTLTNTMGILSSILSIAVDSGLSAEEVKRLLGL